MHVRAGGEIVKVGPFSMTITGNLGQWRLWTRLAFADNTRVVVPGGLSPVMVSQEQDCGVYVEANVWVRYRLD